MTEAQDATAHDDPPARAHLLPLELVVVDHYARESRFVVDTLPAILGRDDKAAVPLIDPWVSHAHCEIYQLGSTIVVRDLDSKNGIFVHGHRVREAEVISGDRLTLGRTEVTLNFGPKSMATQEVAITATAPKPAPQTAGKGPSRGPETEQLLY